MTALAEFLFSLSTCGVVGLVGLLFVADYGEYWDHSVVDAFDIVVGARVVGGCGDCVLRESLEQIGSHYRKGE